jgi:hypothetical protein
MFRKLALALGATAVLGAAALSPAAALAWHPHHHHGFGWGFGIYAPTYVAGPDCYLVKRTFERRDGSNGVRYVSMCD